LFGIDNDGLACWRACSVVRILILGGGVWGCDLAGALGWELDGVVGFFEIKSNFLKDWVQNNQITKYLIKII